MRLKNKVAVVTGAAAGIGEATALRFSREGARVLALDLRPFNIRVNCICPGVTLTPALERVFVEYNVEPEQAVQDFIAHRCHIKRFGRPEEIASAILLAASDEASYMTGATLVVDGGYSA